MCSYLKISPHVKSPNSSALHKSGSPFFSPAIQPKLIVNEPGDMYEQEADAMADKVMRMPATAEKKPFFTAAPSFIQKQGPASPGGDVGKTLTEGVSVVKDKLDDQPGFKEWQDAQTDALKKKVWDS